MTVTVLEPNPRANLTTLDRVKMVLGIGSSDASKDDFLEYLIESQSAVIYNYIGRSLAYEKVRERLPSHGTVRLMVSRVPVVNIEAVSYRGSTVSSTAYYVENDNAGFLFRPDGWTQTRIYGHSLTPYYTGEDEKQWEITYTAGYNMPGSTDGSTAAQSLPADLEKVCIDLVATEYSKSPAGNDDDYSPLVTRRRTGDAEIYYATPQQSGISNTSKGLPMEIANRLDPYVRGDSP